MDFSGIFAELEDLLLELSTFQHIRTFYSLHYQNRLTCLGGELFLCYAIALHLQDNFNPPSACHTHITQTWQEENNVIYVTRQKRRKKLELGEKACWCLVSAENLQLSAWIFLFCWYLMPLEWDSIINYLCGAFKNSMDKSYSLYL